MQRYNPKEIEPKWQKDWLDNKSYEVHDDAPGQKFYHLVEFPYPSGAGLHVGHCRPYITFDVMARWRRMNGENVLYPMGWDAFGLPAEQYAIKTGVHPAVTTKTNIDNFRRQAQSLGLSFDWSREVSTADPKYYKWTQWIFLQLFKHGLAYQAESQIWWCEGLKSVLADEEVINGRSERGDFPCERRSLRQWMLAITKYADRLYDDLDDVDYIEPVKIQQRNWIGRSKGAEVDFALQGTDKTIRIFTTRPDTMFGATFMVLAPEHPFVKDITTPGQAAAVAAYVKQTASKSDLERQENADKEKTGVFTGAMAINPATGKAIPVWISDYVLMGYGTGAIMAVPAHDERDNDFAKKFDLPVVTVVEPDGAKDAEPVLHVGEGTMINSGEYNGMRSSDVREKIVADLSAKGVATEHTNYRLRDWVFSRQRYWGEPFPIVWVKQDEAEATNGAAEWMPETPVTKQIDGITYQAMPVPPSFLPVELPEVEDFQPKGLGQGPLAEATEWVHVWYDLATGATKPFDGNKPGDTWVEGSRETDTMPNWAGSSWYFLRYLDPANDTMLVGKDAVNKWMPVDWYNGGMEHTTLHLLYSRFWHKFLFDIGVVNTPEPYQKRTSHGLVLAEDGRKMSKSWGNVVDPLEVVGNYGADTLRLYICFMGPFEQTVAWSVNGVAGCRRFIDRLWVQAQEFLAIQSGQNTADAAPLRRALAAANKRITNDVPRMGFNTAVAALMEAVNELYKLKHDIPFATAYDAWRQALVDLTSLLAPFAPHVGEELWRQLSQEGSVLQAAWPTYDEADLASDTMTIVVQVNGKLRAEFTVGRSATEAEIVAQATANDRVRPYVEGRTIKKTIYVPGKLVNFVI
ncbi:MAG TPA: leucine--tRNA ligase [Candidatus Saccharimonadales bacterium]|nr:leucine--tRNA ligase [Candidatus Saccharimonadales bacterium]